MYRLTIEIESDHFAGFHAIVMDAADVVLHVTDSYLSPEDAKQVAQQWIADYHRWPATA